MTLPGRPITVSFTVVASPASLVASAATVPNVVSSKGFLLAALAVTFLCRRAQGSAVNRSRRSVARRASPSSGRTPQISCTVRRRELCV